MNTKNPRSALRPAVGAIAALYMGSALWAVDAFAQAAPAAPAAPPAARAPARAAAPAPAAPAAPSAAAQANAGPRTACVSVVSAGAVNVPLGKSRVLTLPAPAARLIGAGRPSSWVGQAVDIEEQQAPNARGRNAADRQASNFDGVADTEITLLSPTEILVIGRRAGSSNVIVQDREGRCVVRDIFVTIDPDTLQNKLGELLPGERGIKVSGADNAVVLTGTVRDAVALDQAMSVAMAYGDGKKVVNLLRIDAPQQVMLEVKIAEVSKGLLDRFGLDFSRAVSSADGRTTNVFSGVIGGRSGVVGRMGSNQPTQLADGRVIPPGILNGSAAVAAGRTGAAAAATFSGATLGASVLGLDMETQDGIVRVLAEPNIMAISGQAASFRSGGRIFIPVSQSNNGGAPVITLEEKEFGVGLKFTPTVLDGRINLKLYTEVSELSQAGSPFTTIGGITAVLPSMSTRQVDTTVQLGDGQSFAVAGLIKNNVTEALNKFPGLGDTPVLGALFRSTEFQNDKTELLFVITPRLVKPTTGPVRLPTDNHVAPSRSDVILRGKGEGSAPADTPVAPSPAPATAPAAAPRSQAPAEPAQPTPVAPVSDAPAQPLPALANAAPAAQTTAQ